MLLFLQISSELEGASKGGNRSFKSESCRVGAFKLTV